jgi:DNA primase
MIPIRNLQGQTIGFGGRELPLPKNLITEEELQALEREYKAGKYINSPTSIVFSKKKNLFGIDVAADIAKKEGYVIMVEGYFDVIALYEAGVRNSVASMGTAVTIEQLLLAASLSEQRIIILLFDDDLAGKTAAIRASKLVNKHNMKIQKIQEEMNLSDSSLIDIPLQDQQQQIRLKRASMSDALAYISKQRLTRKDGSRLPSETVFKDCADICQDFTATNVRKIMKEMVKVAREIEDDEESGNDSKHHQYHPSPPQPQSQSQAVSYQQRHDQNDQHLSQERKTTTTRNTPNTSKIYSGTTTSTEEWTYDQMI